MIATFQRAADVALTPCEPGSESPGISGEVPQVYVADGDYTVASESAGQGILVVTGDLVVDQQLDFEGIIIVGGTVSIRLPRPMRARLLIQGTTTDLAQPALTTTQSLVGVFSPEALQTAATALDGDLELLTWEQETQIEGTVLPPGGYQPPPTGY